MSGEIYEVDEADIKNIDGFQIPLKERPRSCRKCHGYFYIHYSLSQKCYIICPRCAKKYIDFANLLGDGKKENH